MTAKQLVDLIHANFKDDEEVIFLYDDDQGEERAYNAKVKLNTMTLYNGHYEARIKCTDIWEKVADSSDEFNRVRHTDEYKSKYFEWR